MLAVLQGSRKARALSIEGFGAKVGHGAVTIAAHGSVYIRSKQWVAASVA
jgi:hypothetical protein